MLATLHRHSTHSLLSFVDTRRALEERMILHAASQQNTTTHNTTYESREKNCSSLNQKQSNLANFSNVSESLEM